MHEVDNSLEEKEKPKNQKVPFKSKNAHMQLKDGRARLKWTITQIRRRRE